MFIFVQILTRNPEVWIVEFYGNLNCKIGVCKIGVKSWLLINCWQVADKSTNRNNMARAWRIEYEGALYHVLSRGNDRQDIVINDDDRTLFLETVAEMADRFKLDIFAYVLMDNHYH